MGVNPSFSISIKLLVILIALLALVNFNDLSVRMINKQCTLAKHRGYK